jgi:hypothetical protein
LLTYSRIGYGAWRGSRIIVYQGKCWVWTGWQGPARGAVRLADRGLASRVDLAGSDAVGAVSGRPPTPGAATDDIDQIVTEPRVRLAGARDGFRPVYRRVAGAVTPGGDVVPDAHVVAVLSRHGISPSWTRNHGVRKSDGLAVRTVRRRTP